ncbi:MAG: ABC transporter permease [Candidatus Thermoplasmatota archaeon]|nr:ABC transporter permease [Euryarchaeota archaeon]MBU4032842.1 ABC transporter permease [Candidatus Thermoplasmatota archaeon]MBU4070593.1 ABC transporter permease [Candidatus Thermoplasmatota archaeon]MBU4145240.1 ABC transporter permease [Candidatus Thermoplasmatota archaeon]MBU4591207.1 ABC transporter permease [Candidatus Thermoplasmatota archaeon]
MAKMGRYIFGRVLQAAVTLLIVTSIIFMLFEAMPGDPLAKFRADPTTTEARLTQLENLYGLNDPIHVRYYRFMTNMFTFNFGYSYSKGGPVIDQIELRAPRTLILFGAATIISYALGVAVGSYIAWRRGGVAEGAIISSSLFFYNMPSFWIGLIMIWVFANKWKYFPLGGFTGMEETVAFFGLSGGESYLKILDFGWHMALPLIVMVLIGVAGVILLMRTSLLEVMREDYILTAKAKGLSERHVRIRHANRNAYLPIVTSFTLSMASVLGGAVILEQVFSYQGMGLLYLDALYNQDHFLSGAVLFILSLLVIFANIVADLLYGVLDPRVRL